MVELRDRRIVIDDKPVLILAGEVHYFRLPKSAWEDRIRKLKALGCNAVATYIPWIVHEEREGDIDLIGRLRAENDLGAYIDLCHRHGLWFIARPGPFVMAEMKNEGIPFWMYERYPDTIPVTWKGAKAETRTLDYLSPDFLKGAKRWYEAVMPLLASRLQSKGGPVIAVQLDNEIGMLSWVSNQPDLSDDTLCEFAKWLVGCYSHEELAKRYPFDWNDPMPRAMGVRNPKPEIGGVLHRDLGDFERHRIARYVATLREYAEASGVRDVPFLVNIHGSGGGRGTQFPIGIHQLYESYTQAPGYLAGSDHYLGDITRGNAQDLYYINAFMAAVNRPEQPLSSLEFEVGSGDYGENGALRYSGAAADFKARLSVMQGNRLLNYYLLAGGTNPPLLTAIGDGNDRIGTTGQRHGFAAPISPEGRLDPTYYSLRDTTLALNAVASKLANMDEELDNLALAFVPDYYKTDFHQPGLMQEIVSGLEEAREPLENLTRAMLALGFRFTALDIQHRPLDPSLTPVLAFASAAYLDEAVQRKLVDYVRAGGKLMLQGRVPAFDMEGKPCTVLSDALGIEPVGIRQASNVYHLSLKGQNWLADEPEVRNWRVEAMANHPGSFLKLVGTSESCGIEADLGKGRAIVMTVNYPLHAAAFRTIFGRLGAVVGLVHDDDTRGTLTTTVANRDGERFLSVMNLDLEPKVLRLYDRGKSMFGGAPIQMPGRHARLLPLDVRFGPVLIRYSTAELLHVEEHSIAFRPTAVHEVVEIDSSGELRISEADFRRSGNRWTITTRPSISAKIDF